MAWHRRVARASRQPTFVEAVPNLQSYDRVGLSGEAALDDLTATFVAAELVAPSVPAFLVPRLSVVERWCWATAADHRLGDLYAVDPRFANGAVAESLNDGPSDGVFACEHSGHGANSYLVSVAWRVGGAALFVQSAFGGVYMDCGATSSVIEARHRIVTDYLSRIQHDPDDGLVAVAVVSDFAQAGVVLLERAAGTEPNEREFRSITRSDTAGSDAGRWLSALVDAIPVEAMPRRIPSLAPERLLRNWASFIEDGSIGKAYR